MFGKIKINKVDSLWAKLVRERDKKCLKCGIKENLQAHHLFGRSRSSVRYQLENGFTLCSSHHVFNPKWSAHRTEQTFREWARKKLGDTAFTLLEKLSEKPYSRAKAVKEFLEKYMSEEKQKPNPQCKDHRLKFCTLCYPVKKSKKITK